MRALIPAVAVLALLAPPARADQNDLTLERIAGMPASPGAFNDPSDPVKQTQYKSLMSELAVVMAPPILMPADTLGYSGFQLSLQNTNTQISSGADFWQKGVQNVSGPWLSTLSVWARKGIWLPLPGFELGAGATKLFNSNMYAVQGYAKLALHEGFHDWALPSFAVRGAVSRLLGASEVDLTSLAIDASLSKSFGIGGTVTLDPYLGAGTLLTWVRGQVIDETPNVDASKPGNGADINSNTTFPDPDMIVRWRIYTGFRLLYAFLAFTGEFVYTFCNDKATNCGQQPDLTKIVDRSGGQAQINLSVSFLF
jgi:hypothetical protein